jgi:uncharacterized protein (DUF302 family)
MRKTVMGLLIAAMACWANPVLAEGRAGWVVHNTGHSFEELVERLAKAIKAEKMGLVTRASASAGAKGRGITIPGNQIVGVYNNVFAVRMLEASIDAGIEAPIRFYVTEEADGTGKLSYKTPSFVFSPYFDDGGKLKQMASELDVIFAAIAERAVAE